MPNRSSMQIDQNLPFGELNSSDSDVTTHKFTGDERDGETGLDHTLFRKYSSTLGRGTTPDPAGLSAASPAFPQSWNRYSYVNGNPANFTDSIGLVCSGVYGLGDTPCSAANFGGGGGSGSADTIHLRFSR